MNIAQTKKKRFGQRLDDVIKYFFGGTAMASIVVLALITLFLFREGAGFFSQNGHNLRLYRRAGLEFVDLMRGLGDRHQALSGQLQDIRLKQLQTLLQNKSFEQASAELQSFDAFANNFDEAIVPLTDLVGELTDAASAVRDKVKVAEEASAESGGGLESSWFNYEEELKPIRGRLPEYLAASAQVSTIISELLARPPILALPLFQPSLDKFVAAGRQYLTLFPETQRKLESWDPRTPMAWHAPISSFLLGRQWITNSFWQDMYGVMPLVVGSLLASSVALTIAVPFGVASAIYVSELATLREQRIIKPYIEFISAIPSVVLGFFGIAVLGETLRWLTTLSALAWVPFFPISERLNVFTAGCLLALMAIPTIFTLSEDALNNVPVAFKEASYALGASRVQTIARVLVPASLSGIISAVLLGFGRVIGETMVVLLCAGNRIAIPDFSDGAGVLFQPVHTMTGIIAQEMGEVAPGSIHYRALFMVGLLLFCLSLGITQLAQYIVRRFRISIG